MTKEDLETVKVPDYDKIIVELREKESNSLDADNSITETIVKGSLRVINPSDTPIWNAELSLTGDLGENFLLGLIPGKRAWRYNFEMPPVSPPLELKEEIHTNYHDGEPPAVLSVSIPVPLGWQNLTELLRNYLGKSKTLALVRLLSSTCTQRLIHPLHPL